MSFLSHASLAVDLWRVMARGLAFSQVISLCSWMWSNIALEAWVDNKDGVKRMAKHPLERLRGYIALKLASFPTLSKHDLSCLEGKFWILSRVFAYLESSLREASKLPTFWSLQLSRISWVSAFAWSGSSWLYVILKCQRTDRDPLGTVANVYRSLLDIWSSAIL